MDRGSESLAFISFVASGADRVVFSPTFASKPWTMGTRASAFLSSSMMFMAAVNYEAR